jgi:hypothetical protein
MDFMIENCLQLTSTSKSGTNEMYWTFWLRHYDHTGKFTTTSGYRYYPERNKLSLPARLKDSAKGRWNDTSKIDTITYNSVKEECMYKFNREEYERMKAAEVSA